MIRRRQVPDERPGLILVFHAARDPDDRAVDVARPVQLRAPVGDGHRRRAVVEARMLVVDERDAPFAVEVHRELARLERL